MPREAPLADLPALSDTEHVIPIGADDLPPAEAPDIDNTIDTFTLPTGTDAAPAFVSETDPWADRSFAPLTEEAPDFAGLSVENDVLPSPESFVVPEALPPDQPGDYIPSFDLPDAGHIPMVKGKRYAHHPVASAEQVPATNSEIIIAIRSPEVERILVHLRTLSRRGGNYPATRQLVQLLATKLGVSEEQARTLLSLTLDYRASVGTAAAITQLLRGQLPASMSQAPPEQKTSWLMRLRRYIRRRLARVWVRINRTLPLADMAKL